MNTRTRILSAALILIFGTMACGIFSKPPVTRYKTGPTQTVNVQIPMPADLSGGAELNLEFAGGDLKLAPGAIDSLVAGTAMFNVPEFEPKVEKTGVGYTLRSGNLESEGIPVFTKDIKNQWDLQLANTPMTLTINAGAYNGQFELGGLALEKLAISDGGANVTCAFSKPNTIEMAAFKYATGASSARLTGLANANFAQMSFTSGAGEYTLSFDGHLQRDASVTIESGVGTVNIIVPQGVSASLTVDGLLSVNPDAAWSQNDKTYTLAGSGPTLTFTVKMGAGTLNLKTQE